MWRDFYGKLDRVQQARGFKIAASIAIVLLAIGGFVAYWLANPAPAVDTAPIVQPAEVEAETPGLTPEEKAEYKSEVERYQRAVAQLMAGQTDKTSVAVGFAAAAGVVVGAIWLGLGLTLALFVLAAAAVVAPLAAFGSTRDWSRLLGGVALLGASFTVLMRLLSMTFSGSHPVLAIARNTLAEAVRLKLSLLFIVILLFALASVPGMLNAQTPLRYRVQSFLQYATGGSFWFIAVLIVLFSVSTVATEQRGKVIWQTMTKPVSSAQYILGKWLGIAGLAAVLLSVTGVGVFFFVEFLRAQPAHGEIGPFKTRDGDTLSEDRRFLETQILASRVVVENEPVDLATNDPAKFREAVAGYLKEIHDSNAAFDPTDPTNQNDVAKSLNDQLERSYRAVEPAPGWKTYTFKGLADARDKSILLTFRFKIDAGSNRPDVTLKITFAFDRIGLITWDCPLGQYQTITLPPNVIREDGTLSVGVINGAFYGNNLRLNAEPFSFPKSALAVSYSAGSYRLNFARVVFILWVKLAFLAMIGVFAGTFLSFPVASLVAFTVFIAAESTNFIQKALVVFDDMDNKGNVVMWKWVIVRIAESISGIFKLYGDLQPTARIVDGALLSWSQVAVGTTVLAGATGLIYILAVAIFRRRELAIYSGN
ncbi:MAG: hypothetical protein AABZ53_08790 [Planctomycetota bacterium]